MIRHRRVPARAVPGLLTLFAGACLTECTGAGGPSFVTLGVTVRRASGDAGSAGDDLATLCARMPVLLGSRVDREASLPGGLGVKIHATRDRANIAFPGADDGGGGLSFTLAELRAGVSESVNLTAGGDTFDAIVETDCLNP